MRSCAFLQECEGDDYIHLLGTWRPLRSGWQLPGQRDMGRARTQEKRLPARYPSRARTPRSSAPPAGKSGSLAAPSSRMESELESRAGRRLSPAELLAARTRDRKVPQRSHGQKDFTPDGSQEQAERLRRCREEHWQLLAEERVERLGSLVKAEWKPQEGFVELKSPAGKFWHTMGFTEHGKQCLLPEEALYLLECGSIQLFYRDLPLSIQEAYEILLSQGTVSLLQYQVFSHLKRLGYIVLRFCPSVVPSQYERKLNLDSYCKSTGKRHHKRKRSSSPRLQDKKQKVSGNPLEAPGTPEKASESCGDPKKPASGESCLSEKSKESDPASGEGQSSQVATDAVQLSKSPSHSQAKTGDQAAGNSCSGTHPSRWDFTRIAFPNMASDCPHTFLSQPDETLLPENVAGREADATRWCKLVNQKREKLTRKEQAQQERESRYKSSVNADREVRRCSNWQEYKALLKQRSQHRAGRRPSHLWDQPVTPLVKPDQVASAAAVLKQISVLQPSHILDGASRLQEDMAGMKIDFSVYQADAVANFKKNDPGKPYARMCARRFDEPIPSLRVMKRLAYQSEDVPVVFALVDNGEIAFYSFKEFKLPVDTY
ncbi:tRNA-splicing endonuclease subunit Sen54 isoform X2 [Pelodiscus sinensis]|uniref:tRNA-splicing endonuclease subunit Sen54 isoform X2 n=1 Tax=Pelodiscus sinensis TaxID=13735 RepID=UPI003F6D3632